MCSNWRMKSTHAFRTRWIKASVSFICREQMKQIQDELGEGDIFSRDVKDLKGRIEAAGLPEEPKAVALKELERLNQMPPMAPEVGIIRTYVDGILDLPWTKSTPDKSGCQARARILDPRSLWTEESQGAYP